jgi:hypothetical protein
MEKLYRQRLTRYVTAMRNEKPDMVPIRPFVAELTAKYAGYTNQEVTHDYNLAFAAARKCAADFDWDAVVGNMVYVWTGLTQAQGTKYYAIPGINLDADNGFQYLEPSEEESFMKEDEYDELIDDPTAFLYNKWLPRVSTEICGMNERASYRNNLALVKGSMAMLNYFNAFGGQAAALAAESGTPSAIAGIFKAPFDIIGDKLRGYIGLTMDMMTQPEKVMKACEALMPHLYNTALTSSDPNGQLPISYWMHRGCTPFVSKGTFESHYWPTVKPITQELWKNGHQTLYYAEGDWKDHLRHFRDLPDSSIVYHVDRGDIFETHRVLGDKFCLSGGVPNILLSYGKPEEVRARCRKLIEEVAVDGGYIMDSSAIMQDDTSIENLKAMTDATREYGLYSDGVVSVAEDADLKIGPEQGMEFGVDYGMVASCRSKTAVGLCFPWSEKVKEISEIKGDVEIAERVWNEIDSLANMYIWQCLLSF